MQNSLFSDPAVIKASRKFVCVRIESYGSEENQKIVRSYLNGRFANTAFCILAPDGKERLTRGGRGPRQTISTSKGEEFADFLDKISAKYETRGNLEEAVMPDFSSFKIALNVSAADQRLLVLLAGPETQLQKAELRLRELAWDAQIQGRYHFDSDATDEWKKPLSQNDASAGRIYIIKPDVYGLEGEVVKQFPLDAPSDKIAAALAEANANYAATTEKRNHSEHVSQGQRKGISIEMPMPFGEDKDGDGKIDERRGKRRNR